MATGRYKQNWLIQRVSRRRPGPGRNSNQSTASSRKKHASTQVSRVRFPESRPDYKATIPPRDRAAIVSLMAVAGKFMCCRIDCLQRQDLLGVLTKVYKRLGGLLPCATGLKAAARRVDCQFAAADRVPLGWMDPHAISTRSAINGEIRLTFFSSRTKSSCKLLARTTIPVLSPVPGAIGSLGRHGRLSTVCNCRPDRVPDPP